jgi:molecular chaperone DnaK
VDAKNHADSLIFSTEKSLKEYGDKVSAEENKSIEDAIASLKTDISGEDLESIKAKTEALMQASMKLGEAVYKAQQADPAAGANSEDSAAKSDEGKVVDADYEEVDSKGNKQDKKNGTNG